MISEANAGRRRSLLAVRGVSKEFGAIRALQDVSFGVRRGEVVGLMGGNGAGKSTMVKIISGIFAPATGSLHFEDVPAQIASPREARRIDIE